MSKKKPTHFEGVNLATGEVVHTVEVVRLSEQLQERCMMGLLLNLNTEKFYVREVTR